MASPEHQLPNHPNPAEIFAAAKLVQDQLADPASIPQPQIEVVAATAPSVSLEMDEIAVAGLYGYVPVTRLGDVIGWDNVQAMKEDKAANRRRARIRYPREHIARLYY